MSGCPSCGGEMLTVGFNHNFGCPVSMSTVHKPELIRCKCGAIINKGDGHFCANSPPVAPEEAVRLVDDFGKKRAARDLAQTEAARTALLNYMDKQHAEVEETRESWRTVQKMYAALTAEKEAMQEVVQSLIDYRKARLECGLEYTLPHITLMALEQYETTLTPKTPTDSTEER